jgi:hypothetical protein
MPEVSPVVVRIVTTVDKTGAVQATQIIKDVKERADILARRIPLLGGLIGIFGNQMRRSFAEGKLHLLGFMFLFNQIGRTLTGLITGTQTWAAISEIIGAIFEIVLFPVLEPFIDIALRILDWFDSLPEPVQRVIGFLIVVGAVVFTALGFLTSLSIAFSFVKVGMLGVLGPIGLVIAAIVALIAIIFNIGGVRDFLVNVFTGLWRFLSEGFQNLVTTISNTISNIVGNIAEFIRSIVISIVNFLTGLPIIGPAFRAIFGFARGLVGLQAGGIVTRPTLAVLGERGPEAVIPLASPAANIGTFVTTINVNATINSDVDVRMLAARLGELFRQEVMIPARGRF